MKQKIYLPTALEALVLPITLTVVFCTANAGLMRQRYFSTESSEAMLGYGYMLGYKFDTPAVNGFGVFLFWVIIGAIGYAIAALIVLIVHSFLSELKFKQYISSMSAPTVKRARHLELTRLLIRSVAIAGIAAWFAAMVKYILPLLQQNFGSLLQQNDIVAGLSFVVVGSVALFLPIILMRLFVLRVRIFGN